jgi:hypothetical protein
VPLVWIAIVTGKTQIDVPAGIAGIVRMRKTHRKAPKAIARYPAPLSDKLIEGSMQYRRVRGLVEASPSITAQPDDGFCPRCRVMGSKWNVPPYDGAALLGQFARKRAVDTDEPSRMNCSTCESLSARERKRSSSVIEFLSIAKPFTDASERRRRRGRFSSRQKRFKRLSCRIFFRWQ